MAEILTTTDDINAYLPAGVVVADSTNTAELQVAISRIIRGNLSSIFTPVTMAAWNTPANTPEYVQEIAAKLIAAHLYRKYLSQNTTEIADKHYAQRLYDEATVMLMNVQAGLVDLDIPTDPSASELTDADFFPVDDTDRAFTMSMEL